MQQALIEHLDVWTAAVETRSTAGRGSSSKLNLYGIKKLRGLILELAVRGQLVAQDSLPRKVKLAEVTELISGQHLNSDEQNGVSKGMPYFTGASDFGMLNPVVSRWTETPKAIAKKGDVLLSVKGTIGRVNILNLPQAAMGRQVMAVRPTHIQTDFLALVLQANEKYFLSLGVGIAIPGISRKDVLGLEIDLPPLAEQHRIVAKVNELMSLCDALESEQASNINAHQVLVENLLAALTNPTPNTPPSLTLPPQGVEGTRGSSLPSPLAGEGLGMGGMPEWARIAAHFDTLFTTGHSIDQLKQTILQLAVMGKLVAQDPQDEPASVLLKKIATEKARLVKAGKIKKQEPLPPIAEDEKPFELPHGWEWVRLGQALKKLTDGTHHSPLNTETGEYLYISAKNIKPEGVLLSNATYVTKELHDEIYNRCDPEFGDVLYIKDGATTGIVTINNLHEPFSMLSSVALLKVTTDISNKYLLLTLTSPYFYDEMRAGMTGVAITRVTLSKMSQALMALPPLAEQHRIVAKVDELMTLCDQIKARIRTVQTTQLHLADVLAEQAIGKPSVATVACGDMV